MRPSATLQTGWIIAQRLLRSMVGAALLTLVCFDGALPVLNAESPVEVTECAFVCVSRPRVNDPRDRECHCESKVHLPSDATNPYSPAHNLLAAPTKGHSLPNGLSAPLRC